MGWSALNLLATVGALTIAVSVLVFVVNVVRSYRRGELSGDNPWGAATQARATSSPPPAYNFARIPIVDSRYPLWEPGGIAGRVEGLALETPETLVTTVLDARPDHRLVFPKPSIWPFVSAIAVTVLFIGTIFSPWAMVWGAVPVAITLTGWFWPTRKETEAHLALEAKP
jgi:cytochrome c oxidase subunit 1